ncbi:magnesium/cobalt transporter CorA [Phreatobacter sp. AB_2022a]|uniref:magnesium/cobalt transporter CorA n=1 Tax=Phreatobacter sp. AB_2022a TaxID=3003134 RepID=UPI00228765F6|nr:magnesium/cobalt transporter CorA [Phreatobacter sp. AB_2022a]MCZ0736108.1 magnesium/cobalt transporter CorA [Phreatobacter sp. AB_2022a]
MFNAYAVENEALVRIDTTPDAVPANVKWVDLLQPVQGEDKLLEKCLGIEIPTREEMLEIEPSSRLYVDHGVRYMTATLLCNTELGAPKLTQISFVLSPTRLITVRYDTPKPINLFLNRSQKPGSLQASPEAIMTGLLDTIVDRIADILERVGEEIEQASSRIFSGGHGARGASETFQDVLQTLGTKGELVSKARESLVSINRLVLFLATEIEGSKVSKEVRALLKSQSRDAESLTQHCDSLAAKITFLLDAVLGLIGIEQNNIVKIFAVLSVVFMPPTLVGTIYGMNFKAMPELGWDFGYPMALILMILSGVVPYWWFRKKGWL